MGEQSEDMSSHPLQNRHPLTSSARDISRFDGGSFANYSDVSQRVDALEQAIVNVQTTLVGIIDQVDLLWQEMSGAETTRPSQEIAPNDFASSVS
jgi:hypothetical protein